MDHSVFTKSTGSDTIIFAIYVNDIVITGYDAAGIDQLKRFIGIYFHTKFLGNLKYFLRIEVTRSRQGINLCQRM